MGNALSSIWGSRQGYRRSDGRSPARDPLHLFVKSWLFRKKAPETAGFSNKSAFLSIAKPLPIKIYLFWRYTRVSTQDRIAISMKLKSNHSAYYGFWCLWLKFLKKIYCTRFDFKSKTGIFYGGAFDSAKNHKRQRRKRQSVTAKREKSQTPKVV